MIAHRRRLSIPTRRAGRRPAVMFARVRCAAVCALVALSCVVLPLRSWGDGPVSIPGPGQGYLITKTSSSQEAPAGYEGRTDTTEQTAVGNTSETAGKSVVSRFTLGNQIKTCPNADGTAEGTGEYTLTVDSTNVQADGPGHIHIAMRTTAKYKGQVSDDGFLHDPVNADIDYTFTETGTLRGANGALASSPPTNFAQHLTIQVLVSPKAMDTPNFGTLTGGDPTQGNSAEAFAAGAGLATFAGFYYSVAQYKWLNGECVQIHFNPPSYTKQPVLGGQTILNAELKTKTGESVKANFQIAPPSVGSVDPMSASSDPALPAKFTYTAPNKKVPKASFAVSAISHAGAAVGRWDTGLGTDWSGQITCSSTLRGDEGSNDLQKWSNSDTTRMTIDLGNNGQRTITTYGEEKNLAINKQKALRGGAIVLIDDTSSTEEGTLSDASPAMVQVDINKAQGTYSIRAGASTPMKPSKIHTATCVKDRCRSEDLPFYVEGCLTNGISGKLGDLNHLRGSQSDVKSGLGRAHNGTQTLTLTWDLARTGTNGVWKLVVRWDMPPSNSGPKQGAPEGGLRAIPKHFAST
jgi:hypothetical protein